MLYLCNGLWPLPSMSEAGLLQGAVVIKRSTKWFPVVYTALIGFACLAVFVGGYEAGQGNPTVRTVVTQRPRISSHATLTQVLENTEGAAYVHGGRLSELPGFLCAGWTNGANGHGWVTLVCTK